MTLDRDPIEVGEQLQTGYTATVYQGTFGQKTVVLKFVPFIDADFEEFFLRELNIFKELTQYPHPHLVSFIGAYQSTIESEMGGILVLEYLPGGDLTKYFTAYWEKTTIEFRQSIFFQIVQGVAHLHSHNIIHCDLKRENILIDGCGHIKICDFGFARKINLGEVLYDCHREGTAVYAPPELWIYKQYSDKTDMYALSILLWFLYTGIDCYVEVKSGEVCEWEYRRIKDYVCAGHRPVTPSEVVIPPEWGNLIARLWAHHPKDRPTANELLSDEIFKDMKLTTLVKESLDSGQEGQSLGESQKTNFISEESPSTAAVTTSPLAAHDMTQQSPVRSTVQSVDRIPETARRSRPSMFSNYVYDCITAVCCSVQDSDDELGSESRQNNAI